MILFIGGVRSGKSALAEKWIECRAAKRLYLATGKADDPEMALRIEKHRARRGTEWRSLEEALEPEKALREFTLRNTEKCAILLDCISAWIGNLLERGLTCDEILKMAEALFGWLKSLPNFVALVSLECNLGIIPPNELARRYMDILGLVNQLAARQCETVCFVCCGLPLCLKGELSQ